MAPSIAFGGVDQPLDFFFGEIFPRARINCYILYQEAWSGICLFSTKIVICSNQLFHM